MVMVDYYGKMDNIMKANGIIIKKKGVGHGALQKETATSANGKIIKQMDLGFIFGVMEIDMKAVFLIASNMDLDIKKMDKVMSIKDIFREDKKMDMESTTGLMVAIIAVILKMVKNKAKESGDQVLKASTTKAITKKGKDKATACMYGQMELSTKDNIMTISNKAMEKSIGQMDSITKANGKMIYSMVRLKYSILILEQRHVVPILEQRDVVLLIML
jgi:hypothetical protein